MYSAEYAHVQCIYAKVAHKTRKNIGLDALDSNTMLGTEA